MFSPQWNFGHEHCLHSVSILMQCIYGTEVWLCFSIYSLNYNYIAQKRERELIQMTECIGFHVDSFYGMSRVFIFGLSPLLLQIIKQTDDWGENKIKPSQQLVSDLFGIAFTAVGVIQLHFWMFKAATLFWNNCEMKKFVKCVMSN